MSEDLVVVGHEKLELYSGVQMDGNGLEFVADLSFADWEALGDRVKLLARCGMFVLGDWINYGEDSFGEKYSQALDVTDFSYGTLRNVAYVCRKVSREHRRSDLPFSHHSEVARLEADGQVELLAKAAGDGLTVRQLRNEVLRYGSDEAEVERGDHSLRGDDRDVLVEIGRRLSLVAIEDSDELVGFATWLKEILGNIGVDG